MEPRDRLHVKVSRGCNNNCIFCLDDRERRTDVTVEEVRMLLDGHRSLGEMLFTCGEPTIHPRLPEFVRMARDRGYRSIGLVTNGRRLSYRSYAACLLDEGIDEATISIHGSSARVHDALTRTRGSFEQTLAGLDNVLALRGRRGVRVVTSTVIARRNMARAEELIEMLGSRGVDTIVLNVVEPSGEALAHFDTLNPGYEEIAAHLEQAIVRSPHRGRVVVEGIPPCLCRAFLSCTGVRERIHLLEGGKVESLPPDRNHVKTARCEGCDLTAICPGVFVEYVRRRGWDREE
jgi:cyclic pyranopterin phosphate synthase